jgi:hypothetical protein
LAALLTSDGHTLSLTPFKVVKLLNNIVDIDFISVFCLVVEASRGILLGSIYGFVKFGTFGSGLFLRR